MPMLFLPTIGAPRLTRSNTCCRNHLDWIATTHSFKAATTGFGSALHNAGLSSTAAIEKRLAASRLRKFQFHTFATI
jgi:hypothetical protein